MSPNDFQLSQKMLVTKYTRRWIVEKGISEQIHFFHLNMLSSRIVIKVDLDLTMTILAHTLYRLLAQKLTGFEHAEAKTIYRHFIETNAEIVIDYPTVEVKLLKKVHYPILFENETFQKSHTLSWLENAQLKFSTQNTTWNEVWTSPQKWEWKSVLNDPQSTKNSLKLANFNKNHFTSHVSW